MMSVEKRPRNPQTDADGELAQANSVSRPLSFQIPVHSRLLTARIAASFIASL
jgi:hypothetical protein